MRGALVFVQRAFYLAALADPGVLGAVGGIYAGA